MEWIVSPRSLFAVILALVSGGTAAVGVSAYIKNQAAMGVNQEMSKVVVAAVDVPRGMVIKPEHVKLQEIPKNLVHPRAITDLKNVIEHTAVTPLIKDEYVLDGKLVQGPPGLAQVVQEGMRAMTIQTPSVAAGVAGFVLPGNHVDVLLTFSGDNNVKSTATLLQNLKVMAVDDRDEPTRGTKIDINQLRSVTLEVTPEQSQLLQLAQSTGVLHLSLRNPKDINDATSSPVKVTDLPIPQLIPAKPAEVPPVIVDAPPVKPVEVPRHVCVYRGSIQRVEWHTTDGNPVSTEPSDPVRIGPKVVSFYQTTPISGRLDAIGR
jgi:pilus assembly protein CpaB